MNYAAAVKSNLVQFEPSSTTTQPQSYPYPTQYSEEEPGYEVYDKSSSMHDPAPEVYSAEWKRMNGIREDSLYAIMYLPFALSLDVVRQYVGKDGFYFKKTTSDADVYCIWHSIDNPRQIEIWGKSNQRIDQAISRLWKRLFVVINRRVENNQEVNNHEYAWWHENFQFFADLRPRQIIRFHYSDADPQFSL